jgi:hypothetical protein
LTVRVAGAKANPSMLTALGPTGDAGGLPSAGAGIIGMALIPGMALIAGIPGVDATSVLNVGLGWLAG